MIIVWMLFAIGAIATGVCFAQGFRTAGLLGVLGSLVVVGVLLVPGLADARALGLVVAVVYALAMVTFLATRPSSVASATASPARSQRSRRALIGGLIGVVPGALVFAVPLLLHELGAISADASQIGFLGIFLVPVGLIAGVLVGTLSGVHDATGHDAPDGSKVGPRS